MFNLKLAQQQIQVTEQMLKLELAKLILKQQKTVAQNNTKKS